MNKAIEEAARETTRKEYFCESCVYKDDCDLCGGQNTSFDCCECSADSYEDGFKTGTEHVLSLPLSQRLTDEEREKMRKLYKRMIVDVENSDSYDCVPASDLDNAMETLESIFGKELFEEGEG